MSLTGFREAIVGVLEQQTGISFVPGKLEGPVEGRDLGCSWVENVVEQSGDVDIAETLLHVRIFYDYDRSTEPESPYDPAPLEALIDAVPGWLDDVQTSAGPWYFRVTEALVLYDLQGVEFVLLAFSSNPFVTTS